MSEESGVIKLPADEMILSKLRKQQKDDHKLNRNDKGTPKTLCRAILVTKLLQDREIEKGNIREKLKGNAFFPPNLIDEFDNVWAEVEAMIV